MRLLVTGAAGGIGRAVARQAAQTLQAEIALVDRDVEALESLRTELAGLGSKAFTVAADLGTPDGPGLAVAESITHLGGLDTLISNAGMMSGGPLEDLDVGTFDRMFAVNTRATWLLAQAAFDELRRSRGSLVATASLSASHPTPPAGFYSASKAAVRMLVQQLALEWGRYGIRANCVSPGPTDTPLTHASFGAGASDRADANRVYREALIPLHRIGRPDDVAAAILFLAGPGAAQITGVDLPVDGGLSLSVMPVTGGAPGFRLASATPTQEAQ